MTGPTSGNPSASSVPQPSGSPSSSVSDRQQAVNDMKRGLILEAARRVFEAEGLEGASLRAIAAEAGYTPAALYFHFDSKEALYAEVLRASLDRLNTAVTAATARARTAEERLKLAAMGFFRFFQENPRDLDLGFYLFRGGMKPQGLGRERDAMLNAALLAALKPIAEAARELDASAREADILVADTFAHAAGLLLLAQTGRIRLFDAAAADLMARYLDRAVAGLPGARAVSA